MKRLQEAVKAVLFFIAGVGLVWIFAGAFYETHVTYIYEAFRTVRDWSMLGLAAFPLLIALIEYKRKPGTAIAGLFLGSLLVGIWIAAWTLKLLFHWP
jgi:hypothetical protein